MLAVAVKTCSKSRRIAAVIVVGAFAFLAAQVNAQPVFLGPTNPGAENGFDAWYNGVLGGGSVAAGNDDPATGYNCFTIGITNAAAYGTNHADIRSVMFPLRGNRGPFTFSFAYKIPDKVAPGDDIDVDFRFFGEGEDNFLDQTVISVGASTGDSEMTQYKTMTVSNILAPQGAVYADIWIVANIGTPWTSGFAHFDNFSVTAPRRSYGLAILAGVAIGASLLVWLVRSIYVRRRRAKESP